MNKVFSTCLVLSLTGFLAAQPDKIRFHDGTEIKCEFIDFNAKEIIYKAKGGKQTAAADKVQSLTVKKWVDEIDSKCPNAEDFIGEAENQLKAKKNVQAAYCYRRAVEEYLNRGDMSSALSALSELNTKLPASAWAPMHFQLRFNYYMSKNDLKSANKLAETYEADSVKRGFARGFETEAKYFLTVAAVVGGKLPKQTAEARIEDILSKSAGGECDSVFNRALVFKADFYRRQKDYDNAMKLYKRAVERAGLEPDTLARTYLGIGYIHFEKGVTSKDKEAFHQAYLNFLRVFILARDAHRETVAEALYNAAQAVEAWGGLPTSKAEAARLRGRLRLRKPWKDTRWAKKR